MNRWLVVFVAMGFCLSGLQTLAGATVERPLELIRQSTDKVLRVLNDEALKDDPELREEKLWELINAQFDFEEMSKRTLALHWRDRSPQEREEFVSLFSRLLFHTYIDRIEGYSGEKVQYLDEEVQGDRAEVHTKVVDKSLNIPIDYRLNKKSSGWAIYDVSIEGVSLVNNYRKQFHRIIIKDGYPELVARIKAKLQELGQEQDQSGSETQKN